MSTENKTYIEFSWEEWLQVNDPLFESEYEKQNATSGFRPGKKGGTNIRIANGYDNRVTGNDLPLSDTDKTI